MVELGFVPDVLGLDPEVPVLVPGVLGFVPEVPGFEPDVLGLAHTAWHVDSVTP